MGYTLRCADAGVDECDYEAWAETEDELLELAAEHGKEAHGFDEVTSELEEKIREAIKEV